MFTRLTPDETGIGFRNLLKEDNSEFNIVLYPYFYNGGGVAVGDINNDGLPDICFTGNMVKNRLYINKGNFKFEDITEKSGIAMKEGWCTGVTMADVNGDGKMDIYICRSGLSNTSFRKNLLFINNGDLTFRESAEQYGLADAGYSTQASFFDFDKDGDLDMMLINQSKPEFSMGKIEYVQLRDQSADSSLANKLFRNDNGHFTDISKQAGIRSNVLSFSLGLSTADIDKDGWPDIYIANDFKEPDYYYINNHNGTFTEQLGKSIGHTSLYAMGIDVADYNNDALPDIVELDMLPEGNHAQKMHMGTDGFDQYNPLFAKGMPYQYMKNSLQKNNGDGTFSEIGQLAGISNTDWSWSPLLCDFDNDGRKDLFVSNGYKRDNTDIQFMKYAMDQSARMQGGGGGVNVSEYISHMPGIKIENYIYQNSGNDVFVNKIADWGLDEKTLSHGAVYADLDNDGDMDIITNNTDDFAGVYKNNADVLDSNNFLKIKLQGNSKNSLGYGTKIYVYTNGNLFYQEQNPVRGYCSSVDPVLNFGLGRIKNIDSVKVLWNDDKMQVLKNLKPNQTILLTEKDALMSDSIAPQAVHHLFDSTSALLFTHVENDFNDFTVQGLLPNYLSRQGPCMIKGDVNGDGKPDIFIGGAKGQTSQLFIQTEGGHFLNKPEQAFVQDALAEDIAAVFFDADHDGDIDLYVGSGGYEFSAEDPALEDRLYINDGLGNFTKKEHAIPGALVSTGCVAAADINQDGTIDLFVGGRCIPGRYPVAPQSKILLNDGHGNFNDATMNVCPGLKNIGMVTDALWLDLNKDKKPDLVIIGEWMSPGIFLNVNGKLTNASSSFIRFPAKGLWNKIYAADFDNDGDTDLVLGNQGLNNQFHASEQEPESMYYKDFDGNGSVDPVLFYYAGGVSCPAYSRDDIVQQMPFLNKKFIYYTDFADATLNTLFTPEQLKDAGHLSVTNLSTVYLQNEGDQFLLKPLPVEAQYAPVYAISSVDINHDGNKDLIIGGNNTFTRIKFSRYDASHGIIFLGDGKGGFTYVPAWQSGLNVQGNVRSLEVINDEIFFGINNGPVKCYSLH
ncbi:MAG: VCBS repeat-containing protein [Ginsengibacter sp.]